MKLAKHVDPVTCFLTLLTVGGDFPKAAASLGMSEKALRETAAATGLDKHLKQHLAKGKRKGAEDVSAEGRRLNRAVNYIQAARARTLVDRAIQTLLKQTEDPDEVLSLFTVTSPTSGSRLDFKPLRELVAAAQISQQMTAQALGDSAEQTREDSRDNATGASIGLDVTKALSALEAVGQSSVDAVRKLNDTTLDEQPETFPVDSPSAD